MSGSLAEIRRGRMRLSSGVHIPTLEWGGQGPLVLLHHATGICGAAWHAIARQLTDVCRPVAFDARGHGDADKPEHGYDWQTYADDLVEIGERFCEQLACPSVALGVGHSLGGIALLLASQRRPALFDAALLLEPALITRAMDAAVPRRRDGSTVTSTATRLRQCRFASRAEAARVLSQQAGYAHWDPETFEHYLQEGLRDLPTGGVELRCPPEIEARIYALGPNDAAFVPGAVKMPVTLLSVPGSRFADAHGLFAEQHACVRLVVHEGSHQLPMERPAEMARYITELLPAARV